MPKASKVKTRRLYLDILIICARGVRYPEEEKSSQVLVCDWVVGSILGETTYQSLTLWEISEGSCRSTLSIGVSFWIVDPEYHLLFPHYPRGATGRCSAKT